jgi:hypothetical protein
MIFRVAERNLRNPEEAEEVMQAVLHTISRVEAKFDAPAARPRSYRRFFYADCTCTSSAARPRLRRKASKKPARPWLPPFMNLLAAKSPACMPVGSDIRENAREVAGDEGIDREVGSWTSWLPSPSIAEQPV